MEIYVSQKEEHSGDGSYFHPFKTISEAAVHTDTYTYENAPGCTQVQPGAKYYDEKTRVKTLRFLRF